MKQKNWVYREKFRHFRSGSRWIYTDVRVLRGIGAGCDEEAVRVVRICLDGLPGKTAGVPVPCSI